MSTVVATSPVGPVTAIDTLPLTATISGNLITLAWIPISCLGYVLYVNGKRISNSWDPSKSSWKATYAVGNIYHIVAVQETASGTYLG